MAERCVKGDYIGFTFGNVHSSELGLMRVSNGSRYEQDLLPPLQDKTAQVNGRDGAVYFNSQYNTKPIKVPVAFDNMTEESFQKLKELVMDKKPKYLWFDETPYKQWLVKAGGLQSFKWVCFDESKNIERLDDGDSEGTKKRIYKGEGTLEFVCFTPYAESRVTFLDDPVDGVWVWNREESPKRLIKITQEDINNEKYYTMANLIEPYLQANPVPNKRIFANSFDFNQDEIIAVPSEIEGLFNIYYYENNEKIILEKYRILCDLVVMPYATGMRTSWIDMFNQQSSLYTYTSDLKTGLGTSYLYSTETESDSKPTLFIRRIHDGEYVSYGDSKKYIQLERGKITLEYNYNFNEWKKTSKLCFQNENSYNYNTIQKNQWNENIMNIYNAGTEKTNISILFNSALLEPEEEKIKLELYHYTDINFQYPIEKIILKSFKLKEEDNGFVIDSKLKIIKGFKILDDGSKIFTGNIYSKYHIGGDYFKIPVCANDEYYIIKSTSENEFTVDYKHYYI